MAIVGVHPWSKASENGNFLLECRNQFRRLLGHVVNTKQSNLKFGKFILHKKARICMLFRTLARNTNICELAMKSLGKKNSLSKN